MASNLLETLTGLLTPDVISKAASTLGEPTAGVGKAAGAAFPSLLAGIIGKSGHPGSMDQLFRLVASPLNDGSALNSVGGLLPGLTSGAASGATSQMKDLGGKFLNQLFGPQLGGIAGALGQFAGIKTSSATSILGLAAPLVLGTLGKTVRTQGLTATGLTDLLDSQKSSILSALPAGLAGPLGVGDLMKSARDLAPAAAGRRPRWLIPVAAVLVALLAWWGLRPKTAEIQQASTGALGDASHAVAGAASSAEGALSQLTLPDGREIDGAVGGIEDKLLAFIQDASSIPNKETWFDFDRLLFETNSATLKPESQDQLGNVAVILASYPSVHVKIGGYTDNLGDPAANLKLSQDRADNVKRELVTLGVAESRLAAEGYGDQHAVADNATEAGRAQNRRISLRVTAK